MTTAVPSANAAKILIVDDELGPRESLRMLLKPAYQTATADSGPAALEQIERFRPDVVVMDIKMPEMDGLEVLRRIKRLDASIEVVMITAYASLETVKLALTHGAFEYLIKPFPRQDLEDVVRRALLRRQADQGARGELAVLVDEMRRLSTKTRALEEAARRETTEQSLRVTQLSILKEISRAIVSQLDVEDVTTAVTTLLKAGLGYDEVTIAQTPPTPDLADGARVVTCAIRDAEGPLGWLVIDNRHSGRAVDPRETELLEMLSDSLAVALRNSRLYGEIAKAKRYNEHVIASAGDGIISVNALDLVNGWNPAAERIFGLTASEATAKTITNLLPPTEYAIAKRKLADGAERETFEATSPVGPAGGRALAVTLSALRGRRGELDGLIAIVRDITEQREIEAQLHQSEKLQALGQLAGGIAHDFNNLLQAILGYAQLMKQDPANVELIRRSLAVVESAATDGAETVRRIQQFARLRPDEQFMRADVNQIVRDAVAITRPRWEEKIARDNCPLEMRLDLHATETTNGRPAALMEVVTNLILNAMDAMPNGGTLTITTASTAERVTLAVADTGTGMTEAVRRRVFEPFFTTKGDAGSGLGLSMAYSIVHRHSGEIRVETEPGRGTIFKLSFPTTRHPVEAEAAPRVVATRRRARVLLVDDEPQVLAALGVLLELTGHAVEAVCGGPEALVTYTPDRFDVVLTNVGMAGMNGWELAERLRANDARVPILFITGWGLREDDMVRLTALGVRRCLFKPVRPDELDAAIQDALAGD